MSIMYHTVRYGEAREILHMLVSKVTTSHSPVTMRIASEPICPYLLYWLNVVASCNVRTSDTVVKLQDSSYINPMELSISSLRLNAASQHQTLQQTNCKQLASPEHTQIAITQQVTYDQHQNLTPRVTPDLIPVFSPP